MRIKSSPCRSITAVDYSDPAVVFWFFGQTPNRRGLLCVTSSPTHNGSPQHHANKDPNNGGREDRILGKKKKNIKADPMGSPAARELMHPLSNCVEVPPLTELQTIILNGGALPIDGIFQYVIKKWRTIKRRDNTNYVGNCRRAIQVNLKQNSQYPLFRRDKLFDDGYWTLCKTLEDSVNTARAFNQDWRKGLIDSDDDADSIFIPREEPADSKANPSPDKAVGAVDESVLETRLQDASPEDNSRESDYNTDEAPDFEKMDPEEERKHPAISELHETICDCINENGGSCHFDMIVHYANKNWSRTKAINTDVKGAVLSALTDSKRIFKRDPKRTGWWMINAERLNNARRENDVGTPLKSRGKGEENSANRAGDARTEEKTNNNNRKKEPEVQEEEDEEGKANSLAGAKRGDPPMTELQILIIEAVDARGGSATFEQIYEYIAPMFDNLRRRDGTKYTSECRRAIQASLSNNPTTRPFFRKEVKKGGILWELAKRSREFLASYRKKKAAGEVTHISEVREEIEDEEDKVEEEEDRIQDEEDIEEDPLQDDEFDSRPQETETTQTQRVSPTHAEVKEEVVVKSEVVPSAVEEEEEEIKDEVESEDETEKSVEADAESIDEGGSPDRHAFGGRVKRAKQVSAAVGSPQTNKRKDVDRAAQELRRKRRR
ncbi:hypothetical protein PROFUN_08854 [Planoprotostelium fungivorum]|uniref:Uncharacterized protein n=1 Tax=Planoprotostelium fungivorum TaxID=1890364 RepID=A0A2P6NIZ9_9EUKA|nr:hypothetical protein PROFUN_08854 [Planoprotostelium fungivorum]